MAILWFFLAPLTLAQKVAQPSFDFTAIGAIVQQAIAKGEVHGAVVLVGHNARVVYRRAFGQRVFRTKLEPMTPETIFDLASLTKVVATTPCVMRLLEEGKIRLNDPVARYLPEFSQNGKEDVTIRQLLTHFSGLPPDLDLAESWSGRSEGLRRAFKSQLQYPPGSQFLYSDINFIVLGALVERVSGKPLEQFVEEEVFRPLGMERTRFLPPKEWLPEIAPTQYDEHGVMLRGVVHDPTARRMGGVAGDAGVFSTADDLSRYAQALLDGKILSPASINKMTTPQQPANATVLRGLGWDIDSPFSSNRGELLPLGSYGHTGFTGTSLWIDPSSSTYIIILTNAVYPRGQGNAVPLRGKIANAVAIALQLNRADEENVKMLAITGYNETLAGMRRLATRNGSVLTGIDVLEAQHFAPLLAGHANAKPLRIGLLTNQTGVNQEGRRTIDVLASAPGIQLTAIFSPEHGVNGTLDAATIVNSVDSTTQIPVYSVYGSTDDQRRPPAAALVNLDAVVVDLQDVGARFYTYETTLGYFLEAAATAKVKVFVLDRPNPITGSFVQGPISDSTLTSFVNYYPLPVRHGMTLGELARLFNEEGGIHADLSVIPMQGWQRGDWYDSTALTWINPSPNLRSLEEAILYPGAALIEGTNTSVGRGTDMPFELVGAPWVKARELADYLNRRNISGVRFLPHEFTPASGPYAGQRCAGVNILLTDRNALNAPELGLELASALRGLYPKEFKIEEMAMLLADSRVLQALLSGEDPRRITEEGNAGLEEFIKLRKKYLLYP
jgi:uncharacterized protein YbbC (DUF1343 family)/CubicO group peptidase (beta-lactamase class C family)